jgi:hypothetical protein
MWAAALIGLAAGGPFGVCLVIAAGITTFIKANKVDAEYAKRGEMPPTAKLIDKWLDQRAKAGKPVKPAKYGMWRYGWLRWQAMWQDLSERFEQTRADYRDEAVKAKAAGQPPPTKPSIKDRLAGWKWSITNLTAAKTAAPDTAVPAPASAPSAVEPRWHCDKCGIGCGGYDSEDARDSDARMHIDKVHNGGGRLIDQLIHITDHADENLTHADTPAVTAHAAATAIVSPADQHQDRPRRAGTAEKENSMTATIEPQQSGEVTGTRSAAAYARAVADAHERHSGNEGYLSSLARMEVGDGDLGLVRDAMQTSKLAAAKWTAAADSIDANNAGLREHYANAPDAANKAANINE